MEIVPNEEDKENLDLVCLARFATTEIEFSSRTYRVGITQARLQLYLDGWQQKLGKDLGDCGIPTVEATSKRVNETSIHGNVDAAAKTSGAAQGGLETGASKKAIKTETLRSTATIQPVTVLPNGAWRIQANDIDKSENRQLEGSAIAGERLCVLQKRDGSNRSRVIGELQVRRSKISIQPTKGNRLGKAISLLRNKDSIVAKILENALTREAEQATDRRIETTVVASKVEFEEA